MIQPKAGMKGAFLLGIVLYVILPACTAFVQADDTGLIRALQTDSAPIENTYYFQASFNNDMAPRHGFYLYGEGLLALGKDWGVNIHFPTLITQQPLGRVPAVLGPIGLFVRYQAYHFGGWYDETSGAFSIQAGGSFGFSATSTPSAGSSWSIEGLGGYRVGRFFLQADYGYQGGIDSKASSVWQANTALGYRLNNEWYVQTEADFSAVTDPFKNSSWSFIPQIAFQPGDWLFEWGESLGNSPSGFTELMIARTF